MPAGSDRPPGPALTPLPHTWRPLGVRIAVIGFGVMLLVVCAAAWFGFDESVRDRFSLLQRLTLGLMGAGLAACGWALARARVTAEMEALVVVNGFRTRHLAWEEVIAIHYDTYSNLVAAQNTTGYRVPSAEWPPRAGGAQAPTAATARGDAS